MLALLHFFTSLLFSLSLLSYSKCSSLSPISSILVPRRSSQAKVHDGWYMRIRYQVWVILTIVRLRSNALPRSYLTLTSLR